MGLTGGLPFDVVVDILSRLPVKVLCRCKCVSKNWHDLISSDPYFRSLHFGRSKRKPLLLFQGRRRGSFDWKILVQDLHANTQIEFDFASNYVFSCGGLISYLLFNNENKQLYVCNPSTRDLVLLPEYPNSAHLCMGYLPSRNEYKVLNFLEYEDKKIGCQIFTLRDGEGINSSFWRQIEYFPCYQPSFNHSVCLNGTVYTIVTNYKPPGPLFEGVACLDLVDEKFRFLPFPHSWHCRNLCLVDFRGVLALGVAEWENRTLDMWILKGDGIWIKECSFNVVLIANSPIPAFVCHQGEDALIFEEDIWSDKMVLSSYHKNNRTVSKFLDFHSGLTAFVYIDSLFSLQRN